MPSQYREFIPWGGKYAVKGKEVPRPLLGGDKGRPPVQKEEKSQDPNPSTDKTVSQEDFNILLARVKELEKEVSILKKKC